MPTPRVVNVADTGPGSEPTVAASPFDPSLVAVTHQRVVFKGTCDLSGVRVSTDAGRTWREVAREPWRGYCPDFHGQLAWGPRPGGGSRLWWVDAIILAGGGVSVGITYTDDLGATWAPLTINTATPPWVGGFPDITVDTFATSANFGTVYVAYNWLAGSNGPGVGILASKDGGKTWRIAQVPAVGLAGYSDYWRIGYRIKASPEGSAYVTFYESDLVSWDPSDIFNQGSWSNIGRVGYAIARVTFDGVHLRAERPIWAITLAKYFAQPFDPEWQSGLDVNASGRIWLAVGDRPKAGTVHVGYSDDRGASWKWRTFTVPGKNSYKPSLAVEGANVFVGWHALDSSGRASTYYAFSYDGGATYLPVRTIDSSSWSLPAIVNGTGLRESADFVGGTVHYAWGDNRDGLSVYVATIEP